MNLYYYGYKMDDGTIAVNFIIAPDADTAAAIVAVDVTAITLAGGITCDGPARVMAGYPIGIFS